MLGHSTKAELDIFSDIDHILPCFKHEMHCVIVSAFKNISKNCKVVVPVFHKISLLF